MKKFAKIAFGALMLAGAATVAGATPAAAQVSFGIGIGGPAYGGYYDAPYRSYSCDPYSRWFDPYRCGRPYRDYGYSSYGYGPSLVIGSGYYGGSRYGYRGSYRGGYNRGHNGGGHNGGGHGGHHR